MVADTLIQPASLKFFISGFCPIQDLGAHRFDVRSSLFPFGFFFMLVLLLAPRFLPRVKRPSFHQHDITTSTGEKNARSEHNMHACWDPPCLSCLQDPQTCASRSLHRIPVIPRGRDVSTAPDAVSRPFSVKKPRRLGKRRFHTSTGKKLRMSFEFSDMLITCKTHSGLLVLRLIGTPPAVSEPVTSAVTSSTNKKPALEKTPSQ